MWINIVGWAIIICVVGYIVYHRRVTQQTRARDIEIARGFGATMERDAAPLLYDVGRLPFPKHQIRASLIRVLATEYSTPMRGPIEAALLALPSYQADVGEPPIDPVGVHGEKLPETPEEIRVAAERIVQLTSDPRIEELTVLQKGELQDTDAFLRRATAIGVSRAVREEADLWRRVLKRAK
jgi:hypothetical protein